jgi:AcrR family transcriptional regulator
MKHQLPKPTVRYRGNRSVKTRAEILNAAADLASAEGMEGLSVGRLAAELRMSKTGVFAHFGSKQQLQLATVDAAKQIFLAQIVKPSLQSPRGLPRLKAMLENWLSYVERIVFRGGCFFAAAAAEFDSRPGVIRNEVAALSKAWLTALRDEIAVAQREKELSAFLDPAQLAFALHACVQEANWAFKLFNEKSSFLRARRAIADHLASASHKAGPPKRNERKKNE